MSGRSLVTLADGRAVRGYRKTLARRPRRFDPWTDVPHAEPFRLSFLLPGELSFALADGPTWIVGVTIYPAGRDKRVEVEGRGLEWVCKQAAAFVASIAGHLDRRIPFTISRGNYRASSQMIYSAGVEVRFPRKVRKALVFPVQG